MKRYAYYMSCINESMTKEVDRSIDFWQKDLGLEFVKLHEGTCCGGSNLDYVSPKHFALVNARNIALAEKMGLDLVVSCNTCLPPSCRLLQVSRTNCLVFPRGSSRLKLNTLSTS